MTEPLTLAQPVWPLNGYAPGGYTCICCTCEKHFDGDKRATTCLECAITRLRDANKALTAENEEISAKYSGAVERALSILAAKNHWHDKFRVVEAELAQANKCIESLNICIKQDDEREADLSAELAEARKERDDALTRCTMWAGDFAQKCSEAGRLSVERDEARKMVRLTNDVVAEYIRYLDGGEMRGSYDGKPERNGLRKAYYAAVSFLARKEPRP